MIGTVVPYVSMDLYGLEHAVTYWSFKNWFLPLGRGNTYQFYDPIGIGLISIYMYTYKHTYIYKFNIHDLRDQVDYMYIEAIQIQIGYAGDQAEEHFKKKYNVNLIDEIIEGKLQMSDFHVEQTIFMANDSIGSSITIKRPREPDYSQTPLRGLESDLRPEWKAPDYEYQEKHNNGYRSFGKPKPIGHIFRTNVNIRKICTTNVT